MERKSLARSNPRRDDDQEFLRSLPTLMYSQVTSLLMKANLRDEEVDLSMYCTRASE